MRKIIMTLGLLLSLAAPANAADTRVNDMTANPGIASTDLLYCPRGTTNDYKCTIAALTTYLGSLYSGDFTCNGSLLCTLNTVTVGTGGTGDTTLTAHGVLVGEGTSAVAVTGAGTSGQCLTSNGASADPTFQSCGSGGTTAAHPGYVATGTPWYTFFPANYAIGTGGAPATTNTYLTPIYVPKQATFSSLAARVITAGSSNCQLGLYNINASTPNRPGTNIDHTASIANTSANTNITGAMGANQQLLGWYFLAIQCNDTTVRYVVVTSASTPQLGATLGSTTLGNIMTGGAGNYLSGLQTAQAFGIWGDLTSASFTELTNTLLAPFMAAQVFSVP